MFNDELLGKVFVLNEGQKMTINNIVERLSSMEVMLDYLCTQVKHLHEEQWATLRQYFPDLDDYHIGYKHSTGEVYVGRRKTQQEISDEIRYDK